MMHFPLHHRNRFVLFFTIMWGLFGILSSCMSVPQIETPIHEDSQGHIILKTFPESSTKASHPTVLEPEILKATLRGLRVQEQKRLLDSLIGGEGQILPVFTEQEIQFLTPFLIDAFHKATPEEYIWFQTINQQQSQFNTTSGVMYHVNNLLRIGVIEFQKSSRHTRLSSKASFSPTQVKQWTLKFVSTAATPQETNLQDIFFIRAPLGSVSIALNTPERVNRPQNTPLQQKVPSHPSLKNQDGKENDAQMLREEIKELQQQLEGQNNKLKQLEKQLEEKTIK